MKNTITMEDKIKLENDIHENLRGNYDTHLKKAPKVRYDHDVRNDNQIGFSPDYFYSENKTKLCAESLKNVRKIISKFKKDNDIKFNAIVNQNMIYIIFED